MSVEKVKSYFKNFGMEERVIEFPVSSATVELAAAAIGCKPCHIAKTLSFKINDKPVLIVMAGDYKIDNQKYKVYFSQKAKMLTVEEVESATGHTVGGICPFAIPDSVEVYLDVSLKQFEYIYPACGSPNSAIKLTVEELEKYSNFKSWIDVCKLPQEQV